MRPIFHRLSLSLLLVCAVLGCAAPPRTQTGSSADVTTPRSTISKRIVAGALGEPGALGANIDALGIPVPALGSVVNLISAGLTRQNDRGAFIPELADAVPSIENGLWKLLPDGRMETTWRIREGARWHDGTAITAEDVRFTAAVLQDKELATFRDPMLDLVEAVETPDARTITLRWTRPFIEADAMFSGSRAVPLPRHLLEEAYRTDKATFAQLPFWTEQFVGNGPFKLREWFRGSHMIFDANADYALGRPKLDEIELRFFTDPSTLVANLLSGSVEVTMSRSLSLEQAMEIRDQWAAQRKGGSMKPALTSWIVIFPQLHTPSPAVIGDARFRRALLTAIDRQALVDTLQFGSVPIAHTFVAPGAIEYDAVSSSIVQYDYDPTRAARLLEEMGFQRGSDGGIRDAGNERLSVEIRASTVDINQKSMFAVADNWHRVGIASETVAIPPQRIRDQEYVATMPGFLVYRNPNDLRYVQNLRSTRTPLPENNFQASGNISRYMNAELDSLVDRYAATIPMSERLRSLSDVVHHVTDQVTMMGLFFNNDPVVVSDRVLHVTAALQGSSAWNAYEWDTR